MKKYICLFLFLIASLCNTLAEDNVIMKFDFSNISSSNVIDEVSGITARMMGSAKAESMGEYTVLNLGTSNGYLDLTAAAGQKVATLGNFSISCYYFIPETSTITGNGNFLWSFSTSTACGSTSGIYHAYRINAQRIATTPGGYSKEVGFQQGSASAKGRWIHVCYTQSSASGRLYIDGTSVGSSTTMPLLSSTFSTAPQYCWLGRPPFSGDVYLAGAKIYDFCVYDKALTSAVIKEKAALTEQLEYQMKYGTPGDFTKLKTAVESAEAYLQTATASGKYPQAALDDYEDIISYSRFLVNQGKVAQSFIDEQVKVLTAAKTTLNSTSGFVFQSGDITDAYNPERGFRHPGGLHTQEDFDRIKQQIADQNPTVLAAYNVLKSAAYAQSTASSYPVETIVRGGGSGENYINAARGATIAYQNALRWKIDGSTACARHAVDVLMSWAKTTKHISGDSNYALAAGLYGYQFAQAAELVRDYSGWKEADFQLFKRWMLDVWYPSAIGFLRGRNGTWENAGKWWQAPGHYWSNWGLCNALCVISIGVLCDDVNIYNQGMSFIKYDQCGTFRDPRTANPILNDGLTEFWGNLVVTTTEWDQETGAYGKVGQMNESGRDTGHSAMALGLAIDIAHQGWNQGDDLFSYMDHRIAAGIEYVAAQTQSVPNLPWTNYTYGSSGYYYTDSRAWTMTEPALGAQMRPYWATVIGHYEGIKGVEMPFSKKALAEMGIDAGGQGSTSGGYDHLGYSVLLNTRDGIADRTLAPVELQPSMIINGKTVYHNELGMLNNSFSVTPLADRGVAAGTVITLSPMLPEGTTDTGNWEWETGQKTREITITANESYVYRVRYTNQHGTVSEQSYAIAVLGDGMPTTIVPEILVQGTAIQPSNISGDVTGDGVENKTDLTRLVNMVLKKIRTNTNSDVNKDGNVDILDIATLTRRLTSDRTIDYGQTVTLTMNAMGGYGNFEWENGNKTASITLQSMTRPRQITGCFINQAGKRNYVTFRINVNGYTATAN